MKYGHLYRSSYAFSSVRRAAWAGEVLPRLENAKAAGSGEEPAAMIRGVMGVTSLHEHLASVDDVETLDGLFYTASAEVVDVSACRLAVTNVGNRASFVQFLP